MIHRICSALHRDARSLLPHAVLVLLLILAAATVSTAENAENAEIPATKPLPAYLPGEKLTYVISWSDIVNAGTAVMEVKQEHSADGKELIRFFSTAVSTGMVDRFYPVRDTVQSLYDPLEQYSLSYDLKQSHGKRKRARSLVFDHDTKKATYTSDGTTEIVKIKDHIQDALSSLYYLRSRASFTVGTSITVPVHDSGKNWDVEIQILNREKIKTPAGEFDTIKVKTYPKYEGVFMHKGEIFMWLTDDRWRVPVLMKSTITIGSILATLTEMRLGEAAP